jgi:F420-dependent oxidoreductase-like protein
MRIGLMTSTSVGDPASLAEVVDAIARAEADGFASAWVSGRFDGLTQLALAGPRTTRIELGTSVVPTHPRHPAALAQQALTVQAASGGRLTLGIGVSHESVMAGALHFDWSRPAGHLREYLTILRGLLAGETVSFSGGRYTVTNHRLPVADSTTAPPVIVAALRPQMLRLAGELADGTITWLGGPRYLGEVVVPTITSAAAASGRPAPRIVAGVPVRLTDDAAAVRAEVAEQLDRQARQPAYRAILDLDRSVGPADVALIGTEAEIEHGIRTLEDAGVTDLAAQVLPAEPAGMARTWDFLAMLARATVA